MADHLGSTRLAMQGSSVLARYDYLPFGERIGSGVNGRSSLYGSTGSMVISGQDQVVEQQFTAKERDAESGLDYFGARFFMAPAGRFLSADKPFADQFVENPQSWNLYSYTRNNPLRSFKKLKTMNEFWGEQRGSWIHVLGCSVVPILVGLTVA